MFATEDPLEDHIQLVDTVAAAGTPPPPGWTALHGRLQDFANLDSASQTPQRDQLTAAIVGGTDAAIPVMRSLALAECANQQQVQTVTAHVRNAVYQRMRELYDGAAAYTQVATKFDQAAKRFVTAASTVDVEADPVSMIEAPDKARKAWLDAEGFANGLTRLLPAMSAAATLAGIADADRDVALLPLCADLSGVHRRRAWESWVREGGRCGRWSALLKVGAVLRACPLAEHEWYAEPRPLERRQEQIDTPNGKGVRTVEVDPEDADYRRPPIDPRRRQGSVFV